MSGWLYLIKNRDLYKIGVTKNLENRMRQLKPDRVIAKLYTNDYEKLERELREIERLEALIKQQAIRNSQLSDAEKRYILSKSTTKTAVSAELYNSSNIGLS